MQLRPRPVCQGLVAGKQSNRLLVSPLTIARRRFICRTSSQQGNEWMKEASTKLQDGWKNIDKEYDVSRRAQSATKKVKEGLEDIDYKFGIRRRVSILAQDAPRYGTKLKVFLETPVGGAVGIVVLLYLISSGILFRVLNIAFLFMWIAPLFLGPIINKKIRQMQEEAAQAQEEEYRRQQNPFYDFMNSNNGSRQKNPSSKRNEGGPIIDVSYETVDKE